MNGSRSLTSYLATQGGIQFNVMWTFGKEEEGILVCITDSFKQLLEFLLITTLRKHTIIYDIFVITHIIRSLSLKALVQSILVCVVYISMYSPEFKQQQHKDVQ